MYIYYIFLSFIISEIKSQSIQKITEYYKNESIRSFRKDWDVYRKPIENAIESAMKETVGVPGLNVYIRKKKEAVTNGYYHSDNQIKLILQDLRLNTYPRCWLPDVQFSLASNVLKIHSQLSPMIMHAEYSLVRNKSDIIFDPDKQDPLKASPFLFQPVQDVGVVAISMDSCVLSGFIITTLNGESVNLGYQHLKITNCLYGVEIFREGDDSPPVIARYNLNGNDNGMSIAQLLMRQFSEELFPKLQGAMFSFVNTSSIFGNKLQEYMENQEEVFIITSQNLREIIRNLNKITIDMNQGVIEMKNYLLHWNDGRFTRNNSQNKDGGEALILNQMVLTGLDTLYSSHSGGPFKMDTVMVAEEIRFSSLQVSGYVDISSSWSDRYSFACGISDLAVDVQLDIRPGRASKKAESSRFYLRSLQVTSYRQITFAVSSIMFGSAEALIEGYLLSEVPKVVTEHLLGIFPKALRSTNSSDSEEDKPVNVCDKFNYDDHIEDFQSYTDNLKRDIFEKTKQRFKSFKKPYKNNLRAKCKALKNAQKLKESHK